MWQFSDIATGTRHCRVEMFGGKKMAWTNSILKKIALSSSVNTGQTKIPSVAGTGDAELVLFKPKPKL